jgi:septal ring factor EnvC (AmiA/AmiB activator)
VLAAAPAGADEPSALERLIARHLELRDADPAVVTALASLARRAPAPPAPAPDEPAPDEPTTPATAPGRAWPVAGATVRRDGAPADGLRLNVGRAAAVRAPADGRVVFADRVEGLGLVLITAHGDEYHSVMAGLAELDVGVDRSVIAGEPVGRMAERPGDDLDLHLELRHRGRPVDPLPWLGVESAGDGSS